MTKHVPVDRKTARPIYIDRQAHILIVDDSLVVRSILERMIADCPEFEYAASLSNAADAVAYLKINAVDIIILDIEMPNRSGLDALPDIIAQCGDARVLVLSSHCEEGGPAAMQALALGACDTMAKPGKSSFAGQFSLVLRERLGQLVRSQAREIQPSGAMVAPDMAVGDSLLQCIGIGASTGGIPAINAILQGLTAACRAPIFLTQHLPATFIPFFVKQLRDVTSRTVCVAEHRMTVKANHVYVAPGHAHMQLERRGDKVQIMLLDAHDPLQYTPAVDPMFDAIAECYGSEAAVIVLSGMGRDGLLGAEKVHGAGGAIYAQDPETSVVWGMPGVVARAGLADAILPAPQIAAHISSRWTTSP